MEVGGVSNGVGYFSRSEGAEWRVSACKRGIVGKFAGNAWVVENIIPGDGSGRRKVQEACAPSIMEGATTR